MLHAGLLKLAAVVCLILQVWGGTGLDRLCFCIRPTQDPPANSCVSDCCRRHQAPQTDGTLTSHKSGGCCIQARLPDDPTLPPSARDNDPLSGLFFAAPPSTVDPIVAFAHPSPDQPRPDAPVPRVALSLASTRLRL